MWALGYDSDRDELWDAIETRFVDFSGPDIPAISSMGLLGLSLFILIAGTVLVSRARRTS